MIGGIQGILIGKIIYTLVKIHREAVATLSVTSHFSHEAPSLCNMNHGQCHLSLHCIPFAALLDPTKHAYCINLDIVILCCSFFNIANEVAILVPPMPMLWNSADHDETKAATDFIFLFSLVAYTTHPYVLFDVTSDARSQSLHHQSDPYYQTTRNLAGRSWM